MNREDDLKRYYKEIRRRLTCSKESQNEFLAEAHRLVADFLANRPEADFEDIAQNVGKPEEVAETFLNTLSATEVEKYHRARQRRKRLIVASLSLAVIVLLGIIVYISWVKRTTTISEGTVTIISQETDAPSSLAASSKD